MNNSQLDGIEFVDNSVDTSVTPGSDGIKVVDVSLDQSGHGHLTKNNPYFSLPAILEKDVSSLKSLSVAVFNFFKHEPQKGIYVYDYLCDLLAKATNDEVEAFGSKFDTYDLFGFLQSENILNAYKKAKADNSRSRVSSVFASLQDDSNEED